VAVGNVAIATAGEWLLLRRPLAARDSHPAGELKFAVSTLSGRHILGFA
jgi:hypothetical protein